MINSTQGLTDLLPLLQHEYEHTIAAEPWPESIINR